MGFLDRLFGNTNANRNVPPVPQNPYGPAYGQPPASGPASLQPPAPYSPPAAPGYPQQSAPAAAQPPRSADEVAIERYRYLLRTAPPETVEQPAEDADNGK